MKHYEIVLLIHPDQSEQVPSMVTRYEGVITEKGGKIHRKENWERLHLAYPIQLNDREVHKAHYFLLNIECDLATLEELKNSFKFNDAIVRDFIQKQKQAISSPSLMAEKGLKNDHKAPRSGGKAGRFTEIKSEEIDYKNPGKLKEFLMETGRIVPSRITGVSPRKQRFLARAIRIARYLALLPYCDLHTK